MNIFVTNDDGITARGILELIKTLSDMADVYVCAPDRQRTATGHGITVSEPLILTRREVPFAKSAYSCSGTPADCVKLGLRAFQSRGIEMDLVYSGINHGANLGTDTLYSGTVSAAIEGAICGKPAVAISCTSHPSLHLSSCREIAVKMVPLALKLLKKDTGISGILSVNVPDLPKSEIKGVRLARLGAREYEDHFEPKEKGEGVVQYGYFGEPVYYHGLEEGIDVGANQNGYITITPIHYDLTDYEMLKTMQSMEDSHVYV